MANRKLQAEIDRTLKKVAEGLIEFDQTFEKISSAPNSNQKEKHESDLKREIKKLQRLREQIKTWIGQNDVKNKAPLLEARQNVEKEMERYKAHERESKTKEFSNEGLRLKMKQQRQQKQKRNQMTKWLSEFHDRLRGEVESLESEISSLEEKETDDPDELEEDAIRIAELDEKIERHNSIVAQISKLQVKWKAKKVELAPITELKATLKVYVDATDAEELDNLFAEIEEKFEALDLDNLEGDDMYDYDDDEDENDMDNAEENNEDKDEDLAPASEKPKVDLNRPLTPAEKAAKHQKEKDEAEKEKKKQEELEKERQEKAAADKSRSESVPLTPAQLKAQKQQEKKNASQAIPTPAQRSQSQNKSKLKTGQSPPNPAQRSLLRSSRDDVAAPTSSPQTTPKSRKSKGTPMPLGSFAEAASQELFPALGSSASSLASASGLFPGPGSSQGALGDSELLVSQTVAAASRNTSDAPASSGTSATEQATRTSDETQQRGPKEQLEALLLRSLECQPESWDRKSSSDSGESLVPLVEYKPRSPVQTHPSFPSTPAANFDDFSLFEKFDTDTLFFIFYYQQGTYQQYLAAKELKRQSWRYHKKARYLTWFQRHEEPKEITPDYEQGTYVYFDYETGWCQRKKTEFTFEYRYLEDKDLV